MKNIKQNFLLSATIIVCIYISTINVAADPTLESFSIDPEKSAPLSDITVTADIGGEGITAVVVHIKECNKAQGICFSQQSGTMTELETGEFQAQFTLKEDKADYIQYYFDITINDDEVRLLDDSWTIDLLVDSNDNNGDNGTPGFELIILIIAIGVGFILFRKKRL